MDPVPTYLWRKPRSAALAPWVSSVEYVRDPPDHDRERMVPGGDVSLVITLDDSGFAFFDSGPDAGEHWADGSCLVGPQQSPQVVSTRPQRGMLAVNFTPAGAAAFVGTPMSDLTDCYVPLADCWGRDGEVLRERVLEAGSPEELPEESPDRMMATLERVLLTHLIRPLTHDEAVSHAVLALDRGIAVAQVVETFGTTPKPFIRRFTNAIGLTPKRYSRVRRMQRVLHSLPESGAVDWASVAVDHGFYDQSHLIHDFTEIVGVRPSDYCPRSPDAVNHLPC